MGHLKKFVKPMEVNRTLLVSQIFFRRLIFDCCNISICKKGKVKDEASKYICETNGDQIKEDLPKIPHRYLQVWFSF